MIPREFDTVEEIDLNWYDRDRMKRRTLQKRVVYCRGGWALIVFTYQDKGGRGWSPTKHMVSKWRRIATRWRRESSISFQPGDHTVGVIRALLELEELCQTASHTPDRSQDHEPTE